MRGLLAGREAGPTLPDPGKNHAAFSGRHPGRCRLAGEIWRTSSPDHWGGEGAG